MSKLPQHDPDPQGRKAALDAARGRWGVAPVTDLGGVPFLLNVPSTEQPTTEWFLRLLALQPAVQLNRFLNALGSSMGGLSGASVAQLPNPNNPVAVRDAGQAFLTQMFSGPPPSKGGLVAAVAPNPANFSVSDYRSIFKALPAPPVVQHWPGGDDAQFSKFRVTGPNPAKIHRVQLPLSTSGLEDAWTTAIPKLGDICSAGRLYAVDYRPLSAIVSQADRHCPSPIALFEETATKEKKRRRLRPLGVQLAPGSPVVRPADNAWVLVRQAVQIADAIDHELRAHLAQTHFVSELVAIATHHCLCERHPLHALLAPHFTGTAFINDNARSTLIAAGGAVERVFAGEIGSSRDFAVSALKSMELGNLAMPRRFELSGTTDLVDYPFRDDALSVWHEIRRWVHEYCAIYYGGEPELQADGELQDWFRALASPVSAGGVPGCPKPTELSALEDLLTIVIFNASAQHAAVNFPQWTDMSFAPAFAGAAWAALPSSATTVGTQAAWLALLPPRRLALEQAEVLYTLGGVKYALLGEYPRFADARAEAAANRFRLRLAALEEELADRDLARPTQYPHLRPSAIPRSVNI